MSRRQTKNMCEAGHKTHDTKVVDTQLGPFVIYDWEKYRGFPGYCTGQDDVSMTLDLYGVWEPEDWTQLGGWEPGRCLDFGSHIGWYAIPLAEQGHQVLAVDADPTNCELLALNMRRRGLKIEILNSWVADLPRLHFDDVRFIKSDVEGSEDEVMGVCQSIIRRDHPDLLLEVSPEFGGYYPDIYRYLEVLGYEASMPMPATQHNVWFR